MTPAIDPHSVPFADMPQSRPGYQAPEKQLNQKRKGLSRKPRKVSQGGNKAWKPWPRTIPECEALEKSVARSPKSGAFPPIFPFWEVVWREGCR